MDGDWNIAAGQFFTTLRREIHFVSVATKARTISFR